MHMRVDAVRAVRERAPSVCMAMTGVERCGASTVLPAMTWQPRIGFPSRFNGAPMPFSYRASAGPGLSSAESRPECHYVIDPDGLSSADSPRQSFSCTRKTLGPAFMSTHGT